MAEHIPVKIAIVLCTSRQPRCNPQIAYFIHSIIQSSLTKSTSADHTTLELLDLAALALPFHDEPAVPSQIHSASDYTHAHTRSWSALASSFSAFIFVTPQYNWGYPALLKNAIDYLFHEWHGKPAMIVSYGGHGGGKCNAQLRQVLAAVGMRVVEKGVELTFPDRPFLKKAAAGEELGLNGAEEQATMWAKERGEVLEGWKELMGLVGEGGGKR